MLPYYFGLIRVMKGGWKQQFQQCNDATSGEAWGLARWAIKLSYTHSKELCIWQLSGQALPNPRHSESHSDKLPSHLLENQNWTHPSGMWVAKPPLCTRCYCRRCHSYEYLKEEKKKHPVTKENEFFGLLVNWSAEVMMLMWLGRLSSWKCHHSFL